MLSRFHTQFRRLIIYTAIYPPKWLQNLAVYAQSSTASANLYSQCLCNWPSGRKV